MRYFDLHCDTLYRAATEYSSIIDNSFQVNLNKAKIFDSWAQLFAVWIPDELHGKAATDLFLKCVDIYKRDYIYNKQAKMFLSVENASMLSGDINNISLLVENNVKSVTLTWNGENELGGGAHTNSKVGLTDFGAEVIKQLEQNNIAVDVSHASDDLFYDVEKMAKKPFFASHSNSRSVTDNVRNLTDDQFKIIRDMKGVVGLNFHCAFLNDNEGLASIDDIIRHAEHFLNLDGENVLAIGSDFDGAQMPADITGIESIIDIYNRFLTEFGAKLTEKIFFDNANQYLTNFDNKWIS